MVYNIVRFTLVFLLAVVQTIALYAQEKPFIYDSHDKRDPFIPQLSKEGKAIATLDAQKADELRLEGIIWDPKGEPLAVINGNVVGVNDSKYGYTVLEIYADQVKISIGKNIYFLKLFKEGGENE